MAEGELDPDNFGKWFDFANCLKSVMNIIEGQALFPEAKNVKEWTGKIGYSQDLKWDEKPFSDDGTRTGNQSTTDSVLSGQEIGASNLASVSLFFELNIRAFNFSSIFTPFPGD